VRYRVLRRTTDISPDESSQKVKVSSSHIDIPSAPYVIRPTMEHFDLWWQHYFDPDGIHPSELKQHMYSEWEVFNDLPHLSYLSMQNTDQQKRAVAMARFVFIHPHFIDHAKTLTEGYINTHIMRNTLPTGENIRLNVETFNKLNDPKHGISCVISALDM
jgi:hypothetical protein